MRRRTRRRLLKHGVLSASIPVHTEEGVADCVYLTRRWIVMRYRRRRIRAWWVRRISWAVRVGRYEVQWIAH